MAFTLAYTDGTPVRMRDGSLFAYSSRELAQIGRRVLAKDKGRQLLIQGD